jgi:LysR family transcriptional activator of nhaA
VAHYGVGVIGRAAKCQQQFYAISAERRLDHPAVVAITSQAHALLK